MWGGSEPGLPLVHDSYEKRTFTSRLKVFHLPSGQWIIKTTSGNPPLGVMGYSCSTVGDKIYYSVDTVDMMTAITIVSMN